MWHCAVQPGTARHTRSRYSRAISVYEGDKIAKMEGSHQTKGLCLSPEGWLANPMAARLSKKCHLDFSLETELSGRAVG